MWPTLLALAIVLAVALYLALRKDFVIHVARGKVRYQGKPPFPRLHELEEFLLQDLAPRGPIAIAGKRNQGRLRLWFKGLSAGDQQRIRNFLQAL